MKLSKIFFAVIAAGTLSACGMSDMVTRNAPLAGPAVAAEESRWSITDVRVSVPRELRSSEANVYYPLADIVWRGEPMGDRHQQVAEIIRSGLSAGVADMSGGRPAVLEVTVLRFHSLTEKARYTIGGNHSIRFDYVLRDAATGRALTERKRVKTDLKALGGYQAIESDRMGITQAYRVEQHLQGVIRRELVSARRSASLN